MKASFTAPRNGDVRRTVSRMLVTTKDENEMRVLSLIAYALFPVGKRDADFDRWIEMRLKEIDKQPTKASDQ